jgi:hypothetical protein
MDFVSLKTQIEKSRELEVKSGGVTFRMRLPTEYRWRQVTEKHTDENGVVRKSSVGRELTEAALLAWEGLKAEHILAGAGEEAVPFSVDAVLLLLDERQDMADDLAMAMIRALNKRRTEAENTRKNLLRVSSST